MLINKEKDLLQKLYDSLGTLCNRTRNVSYMVYAFENTVRMNNTLLVKLIGPIRAKVWVKNPSEVEIIFISCNSGTIDRVGITFSNVLNRQLNYCQYEKQMLEQLTDDDIMQIANWVYDYINFYSET